MGTYAYLRQEQKKAILLLQAGTFLEYFDLMIYIHMAVLLNELFFPKTDPFTTSLLTASAFCSSYVARPFGALLFGYIGDHVGRKVSVIFTILAMALSCFVIANLPTYEQIGIGAAWAVTICRIIQGMASMGERVGAEIYLTETTKPPIRYPVVSLVSVSADLGTMAALMVASLVTMAGLNWRLIFWVGVGVALIGTSSRIKLRETPDFADAKRKMQLEIKREELKGHPQTAAILRKEISLGKEKIPYTTLAAYFAIQCLWPVVFYITYICCGTLLKDNFGFTPEQVIHQNFIVSVVGVLAGIVLSYLSYRIFPLRILKVQLFLFSPLVLLIPVVLKLADSPYVILGIQCYLVALIPADNPATAVFYSFFPIFKRFTYSSLVCAFSRMLMAIMTSFGLVYLTNIFGYPGILFMLLPVGLSYAWGLHHFENLERDRESIDYSVLGPVIQHRVA